MTRARKAGFGMPGLGIGYFVLYTVALIVAATSNVPFRSAERSRQFPTVVAGGA